MNTFRLSVTRHLRIGNFAIPVALLFASLAPVPAMATIPWLSAIDAASGAETIPSAIKVAPSNEFYVAGTFRFNPNFSGTTLVSRGGVDVFLAKFASTGELEWVVRAGGTGDERAGALDLDMSGNVYMTGGFVDSATFQSADKTSKTVNGFGETMFLAKYSPGGGMDWVQTGQAEFGTNFGLGLAIVQAESIVYLAGVSQGNTVFSSRNGTSSTISGVGTWHMVLARYDTMGNFKWGQTNQAQPNSIPTGVAVDGKANAYVVGWMEDTTTFSSADGKNITITGFSPAQTNTDYPGDAFIVMYDKYGNAKWANHAGGYKGIATAVATNQFDEVTMVGYAGNRDDGAASDAVTIVTSQPGAPNINLGGGILTSPYNIDEFFATWNGEGKLKRAVRTGGTANEKSTGVAYSAEGGLNVVGIYESGGTTGLLWHKYWQSRLLWAKKKQNAATTSESPRAAVDSAGNLHIVGNFIETAQFPPFELTSVGTTDMYLAELPPN